VFLNKFFPRFPRSARRESRKKSFYAVFAHKIAGKNSFSFTPAPSRSLAPAPRAGVVLP
jgi:hypothetical protein